MNNTIWKFDLGLGAQIITVPIGAEILTVQIQKQILCMWALVDPAEAEEERVIKVFGPGHIIENSANLKYIGTFQEMDGDLVWHAFEEYK